MSVSKPVEDWKADRIGSALAGTNPTVLAKLPQSYAVIGDTQFLPGYCVLLVDTRNVDHLADLPRRQRFEFLDGMGILGEAVEAACRASDSGFRRMNYEILGNTTPTFTLMCSRGTTGSPRSTSANRSGSTTRTSSTGLRLRCRLATTTFGHASSPSWSASLFEKPQTSARS